MTEKRLKWVYVCTKPLEALGDIEKLPTYIHTHILVFSSTDVGWG